MEEKEMEEKEEEEGEKEEAGDTTPTAGMSGFCLAKAERMAPPAFV